MRLAGSGRDQAGVVQRVDHLRAFGRLVVDLLVRAGSQEAREGVDHRKQSLPREAGGHRHEILLRDSNLDEPRRLFELDGADPAIGGEVRVEHDEIRPPLDKVEQFSPVGGGHVLELGHRLEPQIRQPCADARDQLGVGTLEVLVVGRARVPAVGAAAFAERDRMLHERDAAALDRPRDEDFRHVLRRALHVAEGARERVVVVSVTGLDVPAEGAQLRFELAERKDFLGRLVGLQFVPVDDRPQVADALVRGRCEGLPVLSLLQLAVSCHHHDATAAAQEPLCPRHSPPFRQAHSERAGVRVDAGHTDVGVSVQPSETPQAQQPLGGNDAERVQRRVEARYVVPLRGEEHIAIWMIPTELGHVELAPQQIDDDVERAEARAEMSRAGALDGNERIRATHVRDERQIVAGTRELFARNQLECYGHGCSRRTSSSTSAPQPGPEGIVSVPSRISGTAVSSSRHGTSSTSTSSMRTFGIAAHH